MTEGSAQVEGYAFDSEGMDGEEGQVEETQTDTSEETEEATPETESDETASTEETTTEETQEEAQTETEDADDTEYTEKGTKLDKNPQSAVHQQLANEKATRSKYERILTDEALFKQYADQMGFEVVSKGNKETVAKVTDEAIQDDLAELITPDNMDDVDKITGVVKKVHGHYQSKLQAQEARIKKMEDQLGGVAASSHREQVLNKLTTEMTSVREKYPELNPKSETYNAELEKEIADHFNELDYDEVTKSYRGKHSLASITDRFMRTAGFFKKAGSKQAQTIVKQKTLGKAVTNKSGAKVAAESNDPATVIASRISNMRNN